MVSVMKAICLEKQLHVAVGRKQLLPRVSFAGGVVIMLRDMFSLEGGRLGGSKWRGVHI